MQNSSLVTHASSETVYQPLLESLVPRQLSRWSQRRRFPHGQVEQDYAKFLHRKGLPPSSFFSQQPSAKTSKPREEPWIDYSVVLGQDHQRLVRAYRGAATIGLGALKVSEQSGVLSRAEINTPTASPQRISDSMLSGGLRSITPSLSSSFGDAFSGKGILLRRF
ncbi:hypothetical protein ANCCAN_18940 [Ancylostoma caninum]|uniref:Uncharacterized protein n=1 Tax=Ancylostoma caninum TaxID=29170 RepID=A0A368FSQ2_ANCCA|nr:hypothetical protein ANCCAN_18940 [Ancylostoma caninum]